MATLKYVSQYFLTTLNVGGGIDDSQTTGIVLQSVSGVTDITKPGQICVSYSDPIDTAIVEWIDYTSINGSNELQGVTRGREGFSAHTHLQNATVAFVVSASHINDIIDTINTIDTTVDNIPNKNYIINGNFDVWQRGTSVALADATVTFQADRWNDGPSKDGGTLPTLTRSRELLTSGDIPNAFYYSRLTTNGAGTSLGVNSSHPYRQKIEHGTRLLCGAGKTITVSFWARSSIANKRICPTIFQRYGTGGSPTALEAILGTPITLTSTWTEYSATFTTNTLVGKTFGTNNDDYVDLNIWTMWGTTWGNTYVQASVTAETYVGSGTIDIAQVKLEQGSTATAFVPLTFEEELKACQRYYEQSYEYGTAVGTATDTGAYKVSGAAGASTIGDIIIGSTPYKVTKRTAATPTYYDAAGTSGKCSLYLASSAKTDGIAVNNSGSNTGSLGFFATTTATTHRGIFVHWKVEAEL